MSPKDKAEILGQHKAGLNLTPEEKALAQRPARILRRAHG